MADIIPQTRSSLHSANMATIFSNHFTAFLNMASYKILFLNTGSVPTSLNELYFSSISIFANFLILKYQGSEKTLFDTNPKTMYAAVISLLLLVYCLRLESEQRSHSAVANGGVRFLPKVYVDRCVFMLWSFTSASLVSLVFHDSIRPILYILCFLLSTFELLHSWRRRILMKIKEWLNDQTINVARLSINGMNRAQYRNQRQRMRPMLPV